MQPGAELHVRAGVGQRPPEPPATVRVRLAGELLGAFTVAGPFADHVLRLPDPLPAGVPVLRFDVPDWRPAKVLANSDDTRDLGIMLDRIARAAADNDPTPPEGIKV